MNTNFIIFHFAYFGSEKTVLDSQVITPADLLRKEGIPVRLLFLKNIGDWFRHPCFFPRIPRNFLCLNTFFVFLVILRSLFRYSTVIIHARGTQGAAVVLPLKRLFRKVKIVCDVRGLEPEEYVLSLGGKPNAAQQAWKKKLESIERATVTQADAVFCVTETMGKYLLKKYGHLGFKHWTVVNCATSFHLYEKALEKRESLREAAGVKDKTVLLYAGQHKQWSTVFSFSTLFETLKKNDPSLHFWVLTPHQKQFEADFKKAKLNESDYTIRFVPFRDLPEALVCGDVGLLLRKDNIVNNVACPTKLGEYLSAGLTVLMTDAVHDASQFVKKENVGVVLPSRSEETQWGEVLTAVLKTAKAEGRVQRSHAAAKKEFDWALNIQKLKETYLKLAGTENQ